MLLQPLIRSLPRPVRYCINRAHITCYADEIEAAIAPPTKQKVADLTLPAFPFAKKAKAPPPAIAKLIAEKVPFRFLSLPL